MATGGDGERFAARLRAVSPSWWARPAVDGRPRVAHVRELVERVAELALTAEGLPSRPLPVLEPHGLADQLAVVLQDLRATGDEDAARAAEELVRACRRGVGGP